MAKKKKEKPTYNGIDFDSYEEIYFYWWCLELQDRGFIESIVTQPQPFRLSDDVVVQYSKPMKKVEDKVLDYTLVNGHIYTADAFIKWNEKAIGIFCFVFPPQGAAKTKSTFSLIACDELLCSYIEVKPIFDQNNMTRLAVNSIKWVLSKHNVFVNLRIPEKLFNSTFTPKRYLTQNIANGARKIKYKNVISLDDLLGKEITTNNKDEENNQLSLL